MKGKRLTLGLLGLLVLLWAYNEWSDRPVPGTGVSDRSHPAVEFGSDPGGVDAILDAFARHRSGVVVESSGLVQRILDDDLDGSRHQRFIVRLQTGHTLLVSHNIDLAPRVPLAEGDRIDFRGQYEWNERGGVLHWTHHDPSGNRAGGWIRHRGDVYR